MKRLVIPLRVRPRLVSSKLTGALAAALLPPSPGLVTRALLGWNLAVWLYLSLVLLMMARADHLRLRRVAAAQAEGAPVDPAFQCWRLRQRQKVSVACARPSSSNTANTSSSIRRRSLKVSSSALPKW